jgi:hypothetical protein
VSRAGRQAPPITFAWAWVSCALCACASAQPTLRISSPADGTVVYPGSSLKVTVEVSPPGAFTDLMLIAADPIGMYQEKGGAPYEYAVPIPKAIAPGQYTIAAMGRPRPGLHLDNVSQGFSKPITIVVERADDPVRLEVFPFDLRLVPGQRMSLQVTGVFADGQKLDLKLSTKTIYTSDSPGVITVEPSSVVHALAPGSARITVSNGKTKTEIPVVVSAPRGR